jgi:predicted alpha/beta superfamily hydrolase
MTWLRMWCFLFLFCALVSPLLSAEGRSVTVILGSALLPDEGVALRFVDNGQVLELRRTSALEFETVFDENLVGQKFEIFRTPRGVPEAGFRGQSVPPRTTAKVDGPHWIFSVAWSDRLPPSDGDTINGNLIEEVITDSPRLSGSRTLRILLPEGYEREPKQTYPLVYFLDGQNLYNAAGAFGGIEWSLDEVALRLAGSGGPKAIFVGIDNGCGDRIQEYTFCEGDISKDGKKELVGGGASKHLDFIRLDVDPLVRRKFRVNEEPAVLVGSSLGGLFGLWTALAHPETFRAIGALSSSIWWSDQAIVNEPFLGNETTRPRLWVDMGTNEGEDSIHHLWLAYQRLKELGWNGETNLRCVVVRGGTHNESAWADRLPAILRYLLTAQDVATSN